MLLLGFLCAFSNLVSENAITRYQGRQVALHQDEKSCGCLTEKCTNKKHLKFYLTKLSDLRERNSSRSLNDTREIAILFIDKALKVITVENVNMYMYGKTILYWAVLFNYVEAVKIRAYPKIK